MAVKASSYKLNIRCKNHPNYRGIRKSKNCDSCALLFVLLHQYGESPDHYLGSLNPYYYFLSDVELDQSCEGLVVETELSPSWLEFTRKPKAA